MGGLETFKGSTVGVLGLARSGLAVSRALLAAGARVRAFDDRPDALGIAVAQGAEPGAGDDAAGLSLLVVSPGVPLTHPAPHGLIAAARAAGIEVTGDIELFAQSRPDLAFVGVTGTNGKSTTTALIHHLLQTAGRNAVLGGNIGRAVFDLVPPAQGATAVLELSSFQLDLTRSLRCRVAVWLNLTPDHLDRHGDLAGYVAAKRRIFMGQAAADTAVIGIGDAISAELADELEQSGRRVLRVAVGRTVEGGIGVVDGTLYDGLDGTPVPAAGLKGLRGLRGLHNQENAAAAYAAVRALGLAPTAAALGLGNFTSLPHRMEEVGRIGDVLFVNDSKATNPEAAARSLACFEKIFWIAGGLAKPGGFKALLPHLVAVRGAYLIGAAEAEIAAALAGRLPAVRPCGTLEAALGQAFADAQAAGGDAVVLLAPACASYDQFKSFEHRGDSFRRLAGELEGTPLLFAPDAAEAPA